MKRILYSMVIALPLSCFVLNACTPDTPSENIPRYIDGLQFNPDYVPGAGVLTAISPAPCLPGQGNCTMILPSSPSVSQDLRAAFSDFKNYYDKNDLESFFGGNRSWDKLFPGLQCSSDTLQKIIDGTYKVRIVNNDKAIIFYNGDSPGTVKILRAYWLKN